MIYLDNSATTYFKPLNVKKEVEVAMNLYTANAGRASHKPAQYTAEKIFEVREKLKQIFGAPFHEVIFTSGCSEALNLAILGSAKQGGHIITTYLEHNSVLRPLEYLKNQGIIHYTVLDDISIQAFENAITPSTYMIITTQVSNVTGEKLPVGEISRVCKKHGLKYLLDTAQGGGHIFDSLEQVDMIAFAGHKGLYGLGGVGGLLVKDVKLNPIKFGGTGSFSESLIQPTDLPDGFEVGTLPTIPIISLGAGIDYVMENKAYLQNKEQYLNKCMYDMLSGLKGVRLYSPSNSQGVFSFNIGEYDSTFVSDYLSEEFGICTRAGLHCAPLVHKHFGTLNRGMVRASISADNTPADILTLEKALGKLLRL